MRYILFFIFLTISLNANIAVTGDDYYIINDKKIETIFPSEYEKESKKVQTIMSKVLNEYEKSYGFSLDDTLYIGLLSSKNQVPNAFSTQFPLNIQMNFVGGAAMVDYMCASSWLQTLLIHESAHNFQLNPKKNPLSNVAHKIVKNTPITSLLFMPIFPVPNILENSFMLEGNAVLNESRFGNGGRLYNGALLALAITQARANYITPKRTYNDHLYFPYSTHHYIVGGFFQFYLAQKYGVDSVNRYFYNFSGQYLPLQTNAIFKQTFGKDYEKELFEYQVWLKNSYSTFKETKGEVITTSKYNTKLNSTSKDILFLTSDALNKPNLHKVSKSTKMDEIHAVTHLFGEVFEVDDSYYTTASKKSDVDEISLGLYDEDGEILNRSKSKIVQGILSDGSFVYFDVKSSFEKPKLYVGDKLYDSVNSSVFIDDKDNIYYFKQDKKVRTLYKNRKKLFSYKGWYGFVTDVNENGILFVANSKNGSSSYIYDGEIYKASDGDDVVDAKFLDDKTLLLETIGANHLSFIKTPIKKSIATIYNREFFFEKDQTFTSSFSDQNISLKKKSYSSISNLHYSSLNHSLMIEEDSVDFTINAQFSDPLVQNVLNTFVSSSDDETIAGIGYGNSKYRLEFGANVYGVLEDTNITDRNYGLNVYAKYPIYQKGYWSIDTKATYLIDHERSERKPLSLSLNFLNHKQYGKSMYPNQKRALSIFATVDRGDNIGGVSFDYFSDITNQSYISASFKYAKSDVEIYGEKKGINIDDNSFSIYNDPSSITMPTIKSDIYVKEALKGSLGLYKVLDLARYYFSFPLSLRREAIYAKYNYYDITFISERSAKFNEYILGGSFDLLFFNKLPIPLSFEYMYNDNLKNPNRFRILFNLPI